MEPGIDQLAKRKLIEFIKERKLLGRKGKLLDQYHLLTLMKAIKPILVRSWNYIIQCLHPSYIWARLPYQNPILGARYEPLDRKGEGSYFYLSPPSVLTEYA